MGYLFNRLYLKIRKMVSNNKTNKTNLVEETIVDFTIIYSNILEF